MKRFLAALGISWDFSATGARDSPVDSGFFEGQFVLHVTAALSSRFTFFGEGSLTDRKDAGTTSSVAGFNAEVERSILKYTQSDFLTDSGCKRPSVVPR